MSDPGYFGIAVVALALSFLAAWGRRALQQFSRRELEEICRRHEDKQRFREILTYDDQVALGVESLQALATVAWTLLAVAWALVRFAPGGRPGFATTAAVFAAVVLVYLVFQLWLPRTLTRLGAAWFVYHFWHLLWLIRRVMTPLVALGEFVDVVIHRLAGRERPKPSEDAFEEELRTIVSRGHREGVLEEDYHEMLVGVIKLRDVDVADIMTPRTEMFTLPADTTVGEALEAIIQRGFTRIPVYRETRDDIIGVLYAKDLLPVLAEDPQARSRSIESLLRQPHFVPETKRVDDLLEEFQRTQNHIAIVLDEYGGVSGLVTIEDILEEIVGEIADEYDRRPVEEIKQIDDHTVEVLAKVHLDELNDRLGIHLEEDGDFDTIGGYVFSTLGRIPRPGEQLQQDNLRITVLEATPRRIERLRIEVLENGKNGNQP